MVHSRCVDHTRPVLDARYPGALVVERAGDGTLTLILEMPFERYLQGIAEVPPSWPIAALEAQAVAARSYALAQTGWTGAPGESLRAPICSTDACQVYAGLPIHPSLAAEPWVDAVRRTGGQVLVSDGRPANTLYFSTSNGRTYGNDVVFGGAPLPYLRPVVERDDGASPEAHWHATISLRDLARFLAAAGDWPAGRAISNARRDGASVTVSGHGITRTVDVSTWRADVNAWAHCLEPGRYPGPGASGARMPITVPSSWFALATRRGSAVLTGRGWGHGVGMVQWGAYGKAKRGLSYRRILAFYYGGLRPVRIREPTSIRVIVASGLTSLTMHGSAPLIVNGRPAGTAGLTVTGGERLTVLAGRA
jgi:stage II sporulation protein D